MIIYDETIDYNQGIWRDYDKDTHVKIRPTTREKYRELNKQATTKKKGFRKAGRDETLFDRLLFDWMIEDWDGPKTKNKDPLPCTTDNKIKVVNVYADFAAWIAEESEALAEEAEVVKGEEIKNSTTGQAGRPTAQKELDPATPAESSGS